MVRLIVLHKVHRFPLHEFGYSEFERLDWKYYWNIGTTELILGEGIKYIQEKLDGLPGYKFMGNMQVFYQDMRKTRIIPYTHLTHCEYVFAIWDVWGNRWLRIDEIEQFCEPRNLGFTPVLKTTQEKITIDEIIEMLERTSAFNPYHKMEGVIITNQTIRLQGKAINAIYDDTAENEELLKMYRGNNYLAGGMKCQ